MLSHLLLAYNPTTTLQTGGVVAVGGRLRWDVTLDLVRLDNGGALTVILETSPTGNDTDWKQLVAFPALSAVGSKALHAGTSVDSPDFAIGAGDIWLRARVTAQTGSATFRVIASGSFIDAASDDDKLLFSQELREWTDGYVRTVGQAEDRVARLVTARKQLPEGAGYIGNLLGTPMGPYTTAGWPWTPAIISTVSPKMEEEFVGKPIGTVLDIDLSMDGVYDAVRSEIVAQAEHLYRRHKLELDPSPQAQVTLRRLTADAANLGDQIALYRAETSIIGVFRGR